MVYPWQDSDCISTTVWLNHLNANETHGEKARW